MKSIINSFVGRSCLGKRNAMRRCHKFASKEMIIAVSSALVSPEADAKMNNLIVRASFHFKFSSFTLSPPRKTSTSLWLDTVVWCRKYFQLQYARKNTLLTLIVVIAACRMKKFSRSAAGDDGGKVSSLARKFSKRPPHVGRKFSLVVSTSERINFLALAKKTFIPL
jgi:hypothetical protein